MRLGLNAWLLAAFCRKGEDVRPALPPVIHPETCQSTNQLRLTSISGCDKCISVSIPLKAMRRMLVAKLFVLHLRISSAKICTSVVLPASCFRRTWGGCATLHTVVPGYRCCRSQRFGSSTQALQACLTRLDPMIHGCSESQWMLRQIADRATCRPVNALPLQPRLTR